MQDKIHRNNFCKVFIFVYIELTNNTFPRRQDRSFLYAKSNQGTDEGRPWKDSQLYQILLHEY